MDMVSGGLELVDESEAIENSFRFGELRRVILAHASWLLHLRPNRMPKIAVSGSTIAVAVAPTFARGR